MATGLATALLSLVFAAGPYTVRVTVDFPRAWQGTLLDLYNESRPLALPPGTPFGSRVEHFVGALAMVRYQITDAAGRLRKQGTIRERVLLLEQSPSLPERPPFEHTVKFVRGVASDCQLFGYDESDLPAADRPAERLQSRGFFRRLRQELYLDDAPRPFAILEWRHATDAIRLTNYAAQN